MIHSYPWYIADWRGSEAVLAMTLEERGLYRELLDHCWEAGSLPTKEDTLRRITRASEKEWKRCWPAVKTQFFEQDGRLRHIKVDEKRPELEEWHESRREAGRKGGLRRGQKLRSSPALSSVTAQVEVGLKPSSSSSPSSTEPPTPFDPIPGLCWFRGAYPEGRYDSKDADQAYLSKVESEADGQAVKDGLLQALVSREWAKDDGAYIPLASNFLWKERFRMKYTPADKPEPPSRYRDVTGKLQ
jgi:uncharacterized protein YdaU (DUF1376 family)